MKGKEIKELQNRLFDHLEPYFIPKGYKMDRKEWNIFDVNHSINLYVNTNHYDNYTLRPGLTIVYKSLLDQIQQIVKTDDFQVFYNGHFDIYQKLSNVFDIHDFDECEENRFNKNKNNFTITVENDNTQQVANRLIEFMESFVWKTIDETSDVNSLYDFYKNIFILFLDDYENEPTRKVTDYRQILDINGYLTLVYLSLEKCDQEIFTIIERYSKIQNYRAYYIDPVEKIITYFKNLQI